MASRTTSQRDTQAGTGAGESRSSLQRKSRPRGAEESQPRVPARVPRNRPSPATSKLEAFYEKYMGHLKSRGSRRPYIYLSHVRRFLHFLNGRQPDRATVEQFMEELSQEGKKPSTCRFIFGVLRSFFHVNGLEWPFGRGESPRVKRGRERALALHPEAVRQMIRTAVAGGYEPDEAACLALVTTYGLRREDMIRVKAGDLRLQEGLITLFDPAKDSEPRVHLLPPEVIPYLRRWGFRRRLSINDLEEMWYRLEAKAGIPHIPFVGWHAIRRTLNTELRRAINPETGHPVSPTSVALFMGWRGEASGEMSDRYISMKYVGWGAEEVQQPLWRTEIDEEIFLVHPFLATWRDHGKDTRSQGAKKGSRKAGR